MTRETDLNELARAIGATQDLIIYHGGAPVGVLATTPTAETAMKSSLSAYGYEAREVVADLAAECSIDSHRPCELSVAVGYAHDLARDAGVEVPELAHLVRHGYGDEVEIRRALEATQEKLVGSAQSDAREVIQFLWPTATAVPPGS